MSRSWLIRLAFIFTILLIWLYWPVGELFTFTPYSVMAVDRQGQLLGARIAEDGQWRFPLPDSIPGKFRTAIRLYEDRRFNYHPGVDPLSLARAIVQNIRAGEIVSGASTLTMQVIRLSRPNRPRNFWEKFIEMGKAIRLDWQRSKTDILTLYAAHAPFGGNVVGLEAASWRYFGRKPEALSWGEITTLAVLPNSPGLIHPGRNRDQLRKKRNTLLDKLYNHGYLDSLSAALAKAEPLPQAPRPLPDRAPHLLESLRKKEGPVHRFVVTLDGNLQDRVTEAIDHFSKRYDLRQIHNMAALVLDIEENEVLAYVGNSPGAGTKHDGLVDIIQAPRSTGSILKPFLYAFMIEEGLLPPHAYVLDVPTQIDNYRPLNFDKKYSGLISASEALVRSLNVPAVRLLQEYGVEKFHYRLQRCGMETLVFDPDHYGLSLILGGAEGTLWDITNMYAACARTIKYYYDRDGMYARSDFHKANVLVGNNKKFKDLEQTPGPLRASAAWKMFETLQDLKRPDALGEWMHFESAAPVAWKTGTSFGFRDAWAIGTDGSYVVGIWVGNADGEGRPGLTGLQKAAPVLFRIFDILPPGEWLESPIDEMMALPVCSVTGWRAGKYCPKDTVLVTRTDWKAKVCPYHITAWVDEGGNWRYYRSCTSIPGNLKQDTFLQLPPVASYYYRQRTAFSNEIPALHPDCREQAGQNGMEWIYPVLDTRLKIPVKLDGERGAAVFQVAHRRPEATLFWHLDEEFIGTTEHPHEMTFSKGPGNYVLRVRDDQGQELMRRIEISSR